MENLNRDIKIFGQITKELLKTKQILLFRQLCNNIELIQDKEKIANGINSLLSSLNKYEQRNLLVQLENVNGEFIKEIKRTLEK